MNKFKVGDRVNAVGDYAWVPNWQNLTIVRVYGGYAAKRDSDNLVGSFVENNLALIPEPPLRSAKERADEYRDLKRRLAEVMKSLIADGYELYHDGKRTAVPVYPDPSKWAWRKTTIEEV